MKWIIHNGQILNPSGEGIRLENVQADVEIAHMDIQVRGDAGISISGVGTNFFELGELIKLLREHLGELPVTDRSTAETILKQVEKDPSPETVPRRLKLIYDMATSVSGSTIASVLRDVLGNLLR